MTEQQAVNEVVALADSQVGYCEGENNWNKYAAELDPLGVTYGAKQNKAWCAEFTLWLFYKCFGIAKALEMLCSPNPTAIPLCKAGAQYFKSEGRWSSTPQVGAIVFFYVSGDINHQGLVTGVSGLSITTVEGNSSDKTSRRTYAINDSQRIAGYGIPKWSVVADDTPVNPITTCVVELPELQKGDKCEAVRALKALLIMHGFKGKFGVKNAYFGSSTEAAVLKFQAARSLEQDGIVGKQTYSALMGVS